MVKRLLLVLAAVGLTACSESPVQPAEEPQSDSDPLGAMATDPLYLDVTGMLSDPALLALGPDERENLSPDDQLLLAAIDLMEASAREGDIG